ncbi:MAG: endolytic transglycosylase MltG [Clostridia bacterium]|nr:endolytic transglycosylase MltG [Clostridia bacterium]
MKNKKKTHTGRGVRFYYLAVALCSLVLGIYLVSVANDALAFVKNDVTVTYTVPEGASSFAIGRQLRQAEIIRHGEAFGLYARKAAPIPGEYVLSALMDYEDILEVLTTPAE